MIIATYDEQRSFAEYIDMTFKDLVIVDSDRCPLMNWGELYDLIRDGYAFDYDAFPIPTDIIRIFENEGSTIFASKRRLKIFCQRTFEKYGGDPKELEEISRKLDEEIEKGMEEAERAFIELADPDELNPFMTL